MPGEEDLIGRKRDQGVLDREQRVAVADLGLDVGVDGLGGVVGKLLGFRAGLVLVTCQPLERPDVRSRRDDMDLDVGVPLPPLDRPLQLILGYGLECDQEHMPRTHTSALPAWANGKRGLLDELGVGLRVCRVPRFQEELELHQDVVVPHRREARDLDRVGADLLGDVVPLFEEGNETLEVGSVLNSNSHRRLSSP